VVRANISFPSLPCGLANNENNFLFPLQLQGFTSCNFFELNATGFACEQCFVKFQTVLKSSESTDWFKGLFTFPMAVSQENNFYHAHLPQALNWWHPVEISNS